MANTFIFGNSKYIITVSICFVLQVYLFAIPSYASAVNNLNNQNNFKIGWASADITPDKPVLIAGQFHARLSEGVMDPITATALAVESTKNRKSKKTILISCDLVKISDGNRSKANLLDKVRELVTASLPDLRPEQIILNATHTHAAPVVSTENVKNLYGIGLDVMAGDEKAINPAAYFEFVAQKIAESAKEAWKNRKTGGISYGLSHAVVSHNRLAAYFSGKSKMYGNADNPDFSHIEGYEDHDINLLYTWNADDELTGVMINVASPSQVSEHSYLLSSDFWHDTRVELGERLGDNIFIFPQVSAAGDQSPHQMFYGEAENRMQKIMGMDSKGSGRGSLGRRKQIAMRISDAVTSILPYMRKNINWNPIFNHRMENVELSRRMLTDQDIKKAQKQSKIWGRKYNAMIDEIKENPNHLNKKREKSKRWYRDLTIAYRKMKRGQVVIKRHELEKKSPRMSVEVHILRIGDIAIATNPFELYLDYGVRIKARSPAIQTFITQLSGSGSYLPPKRSVAGGAYGAVPASTLIGPKGGQQLVEKTLKMISNAWQNYDNFNSHEKSD